MNDRPSDQAQALPTVKDEEGEELAEILEEKLEPVLKGAIQRPEQRRQVMQIVTQVVEQREAYVGPIPHPRHFSEFEKTLPGSADRILRMAENEQQHRHDWEQKALTWNIRSEILGQITGFIACLAFIAGGVVCGYFNQPYLGIAMVGAGASGIVYTLVVRGRKPEEPAADRKPQQPASRKKARGKR